MAAAFQQSAQLAAVAAAAASNADLSSLQQLQHSHKQSTSPQLTTTLGRTTPGNIQAQSQQSKMQPTFHAVTPASGSSVGGGSSNIATSHQTHVGSPILSFPSRRSSSFSNTSSSHIVPGIVVGTSGSSGNVGCGGNSILLGSASGSGNVTASSGGNISAFSSGSLSNTGSSSALMAGTSSSNVGSGTWGSNNLYTCERCGNSYARPHSLNRHVRFECGVEPKFECPICHKKSKHKHNLVLHMRTHQNR